MTEVTCPIDGCDYDGSVSGVEAHISGSTNGTHEGRAGGEFREQLIEEAEGSVESVEDSGGGVLPAGAGVVMATVLLAVIVVADQ